MLITPLILTWNEAPNIERTLQALPWAERILVVDSGSTDGTLDILSRDPRVQVHHRPFDSHSDQWNFALDQAETPWVLTLDADYVLSPALGQEIAGLDLQGPTVAWFADFRYLIHGKPLRGSLYPARPVLFDRSCCRYVPDGHAQRLEIQGAAGRLRGRIDHDDRKPLRRWLEAQSRYAALEADHLLGRDRRILGRADRIRLWIWPAVPLVFLWTWLVKGCVLDGWPGFSYTLQRCLAEGILSLQLLERRLGR